MRVSRSFSLSLTVRCKELTTAVANRARNETTDPWPRGCTALVRRIMYVLVVGSTQSEVPVKPVCPNEPTGNSSPRLLAKGESMSQPRPRRLDALAGCWGVDIFSTSKRLRTAQPLSNASAKTGHVVAAVENSPAWPPTPPMRRAVGIVHNCRAASGPGHRIAWAQCDGSQSAGGKKAR
jgi:hypothetical protein